LTHDGGRWEFSAAGAVQPYEEVEKYESRRTGDRFNPDMLSCYCRALGIRLNDETFYKHTAAVVVSGGGAPEDMQLTLAEARAEIGLPGCEQPEHGSATVKEAPSRSHAQVSMTARRATGRETARTVGEGSEAAVSRGTGAPGECPHCFRSVIPRADNTCPSCQGDFDEASAYPERCAYTVRRNQRLPGICMLCATPTNRSGTFRRGRRGEGSGLTASDRDALGCIGGLLAPVWLSWLPHLLARPDYASSEQVEVRVPLCRQCADSEEIKPLSASFETCSMRFAVHREFRRLAEREDEAREG